MNGMSNQYKLDENEIVNLSFKVPRSFRKRFKQTAVLRGITQQALLSEMLDCYEKS